VSNPSQVTKQGKGREPQTSMLNFLVLGKSLSITKKEKGERANVVVQAENWGKKKRPKPRGCIFPLHKFEKKAGPTSYREKIAIPIVNGKREKERRVELKVLSCASRRRAGPISETAKKNKGGGLTFASQSRLISRKIFISSEGKKGGEVRNQPRVARGGLGTFQTSF